MPLRLWWWLPDSDLGPCRFTIFHIMGREVETGLVRLDQGAHVFSVPRSGLIAFERNP